MIFRSTRLGRFLIDSIDSTDQLRGLLWNSLPVDVQSAPSLTTFRQKLKTRLFRQSYFDICF